jgi:hypothetical protein
MRKGEVALESAATIEEVCQQISRMRYILPFPSLITVLLTRLTALCAEDPSFELTLERHQFTPSQPIIPACELTTVASCAEST